VHELRPYSAPIAISEDSAEDPRVARHLEAVRTQSPEGVLQTRYADQIQAILVNDAGTRLGADPEALHDQRVAVRRLRALLRLVRRLDTPPELEELRSELEWLGDGLGSVRDLDVMLAKLREQIATLGEPDRRAAGAFARDLELERKHARVLLLDALSSERYYGLLDRLDESAELLPQASEEALTALAAKEFRKLRRAVDALPMNPHDAALHRLRIRGKRARYAAELVAPITGKSTARFVKRAKTFQDVLGDHQDATVVEATLRRLHTDTPSEDGGLAVGRLVQLQRERRGAARAVWPSAWRKLERSGRKAWR
jgi:CHAD domain-containing protein